MRLQVLLVAGELKRVPIDRFPQYQTLPCSPAPRPRFGQLQEADLVDAFGPPRAW